MNGRVATSTVSVGRKTWPSIVLSLLAVELVVLYAPTVRWLFDRWTMSVWQNAHGLLIPPVAAYFGYHAMKPLAALPPSSSAWGFAFLVPALFLHAVDAGMHTELLSAAALILALPGFSLLLLGAERTRAIAFPLAFLVFSLPIPLVFTEQIHWQLRQFVTAGTAMLLPLLGIGVFVEGTTLSMAEGSVEIADACSGFSTLYAAAAVAFLTAYFARTNARRVIVLLSAAPLALAANLLRVTALVALVGTQGEWILDTFIHPLSGLLTFALALPVILWLGGEPRGASHS